MHKTTPQKLIVERAYDTLDSETYSHGYLVRNFYGGKRKLENAIKAALIPKKKRNR